MGHNREPWAELAMALCRCAYLRPDLYLDLDAHTKRCPYRVTREILANYMIRLRPLRLTLPNNYETLISQEDADLLGAVKWWRAGNGYAMGRIGSHIPIYLHRIVLERMIGRPLAAGEICDHIDRDRLNNTRENLRVANARQSIMNHPRRKSNTSGYIGVNYIGKKHSRYCTRPWRAYIRVDGKYKSLGTFLTPEEAAQARDKAAQEYYGEFASLNNA